MDNPSPIEPMFTAIDKEVTRVKGTASEVLEAVSSKLQELINTAPGASIATYEIYFFCATPSDPLP